MSVMHYLLSNGVQQPYLFPADIKWELNPKKFTVIEYLIQWPWWQKDNRQDGKYFIPLMIYLCIYMQYSTLWLSLYYYNTFFYVWWKHDTWRNAGTLSSFPNMSWPMFSGDTFLIIYYWWGKYLYFNCQQRYNRWSKKMTEFLIRIPKPEVMVLSRW